MNSEYCDLCKILGEDGPHKPKRKVEVLRCAYMALDGTRLTLHICAPCVEKTRWKKQEEA